MGFWPGAIAPDISSKVTAGIHYSIKVADRFRLREWVPDPLKKLFLRPLHDLALNLVEPDVSDCFVDTKRIQLDAFPNAWNLSILHTDDGYVITFRVAPNPDRYWISYLGVALLDDDFQLISEPQLLDTRLGDNALSYTEDARVFAFKGKMYVIYNDDSEGLFPADRRNMYLAEISYKDNQFSLGQPLMLRHETAFDSQKIQKNWVPFQYEETLLLGYTVAPHEVLLPDLSTGECQVLYRNEWQAKWPWGELRGGTPAVLVDGEYLAFFHSGTARSSAVSPEVALHYYMGAYTFSSTPPFEITSITPVPLIAEGFYTCSDAEKKVIFPGGIVDRGDHLLVAYGKDDRELWVAKVDKLKLKSCLSPVTK